MQFFSVQVLEDVIWKLCTAGHPKLVWCKTNYEEMYFRASR